ncbi:uncharacterized protein J4E88_008865 [Alternaria novae-zelandiae]|uniref:uncharacterized protein n=1 Tax=Alternaria novae-zelandiae TaxID=430562 RepID=UPI0020C30DEF|nr:uncharacterized protein J4E88_008865 [Alternaria novae-zelandiae]KAI4673253.1 hypothetical protein J4E88_008865 [Alternaria novae-zelandiae]
MAVLRNLGLLLDSVNGQHAWKISPMPLALLTGDFQVDTLVQTALYPLSNTHHCLFQSRRIEFPATHMKMYRPHCRKDLRQGIKPALMQIRNEALSFS